MPTDTPHDAQVLAALQPLAAGDGVAVQPAVVVHRAGGHGDRLTWRGSAQTHVGIHACVADNDAAGLVACFPHPVIPSSIAARSNRIIPKASQFLQEHGQTTSPHTSRPSSRAPTRPPRSRSAPGRSRGDVGVQVEHVVRAALIAYSRGSCLCRHVAPTLPPRGVSRPSASLRFNFRSGSGLSDRPDRGYRQRY